MTLKEWNEQLQQLIAERPEALEWEMGTATDDEGNDYNSVCYGPRTCLFEQGELMASTWDENDEEIEIPEEQHNTILLN